ncbi:hypothetical protein D3C80_1227670 [compost metagenome]
MLHAVPGRQIAHHWYVANHALNVALHDALGVTLGRAIHQHVALFVLDQVANKCHQHLGVTETGRLHEVDFANQVIAHRIENGHLKRRCGPTSLLVGGLRRQVKVFIGPLHDGHGRLFVQRR